MLNLLILLFIVLMAWWWTSQGLFSGFIHLILTIVSGAVALALWEPLVYGFLIHRMPEFAWGVGLLVPFAITLLVLRTAFDKLIPANVSFHNMVDMAGGGLMGLLSAILTAGLLVIGLQMCGLPGLAGYDGFQIGKEGTIERTQKLIIPVDTIAAEYFTGLSEGALRPSFSPVTLRQYHPRLAVEAAFFHADAFPKEPYSRRTISPGTAEVIPATYSVLSELPVSLKANLANDPKFRTVVVGTETQLQVEKGIGAADRDATFRINRPQVALVHGAKSAADPSVAAAYPVGFIQEGVWVKMDVEIAASKTGVEKVVHHWVFQIPADHEPRFLSMKQLRIALPEKPQEDPAVVEKLIEATRIIDVAVAGGPDGVEDPDGIAPASAEVVRVADTLPFIASRNFYATTSAELEGDALIAGIGRITRPKDRVGDNLAIRRVYHPKTASVVQVNLGKRDPQSLLGKVLSFAAQATQAPVLIDTQGGRFFAIGYTVAKRSEFRFAFNPNQPLRALSQLELGTIAADDTLVLYYLVPKGTTLVSFDIGQSQSQTINVPVE